MDFKDKVVLITGASSGIGKAIALSFAKLSATLALIDMDGKNLENCSKLCENYDGVKVIKHVIDLRNDELVHKVVNDTEAELGGIDVVVNCAGIFGEAELLSDNAMHVFDKIMAVNLRAVVCLTHCAAPVLVKNKGCIVNISSIGALTPCSDFFAYCLSKSALSHFTKCAALELAPHGVRVNAVLPGIVETNLFKNAGYTQEQHAASIDHFTQLIPLKRAVTVEEVADVVVFLAGAKSVTGADFTVDGGTVLLGKIKEHAQN